MYKLDATPCYIKTRNTIIARPKKKTSNNHIEHLSKGYEILWPPLILYKRNLTQKFKKKTLLNYYSSHFSTHTYHNAHPS